MDDKFDPETIEELTGYTVQDIIAGILQVSGALQTV